MSGIINSPGKKSVYRQTCNWQNNRKPIWYVPKRLLTNARQWKTIVNKEDIVFPGIKGSKLALWRIWNKIDKLKDDSGNRIWECSIYRVKTSIYSRYYLVCRHIARAHSIHGVM